MDKNISKIKKEIADAKSIIKRGQDKKLALLQAEKKLKKLQQQAHQTRLYEIGRTVYSINLASKDNALIAGILLRGMAAISENPAIENELMLKGQKALSDAHSKQPCEVLWETSPDQSQAAILRQSQLRKDQNFKGTQEHKTRYVGHANKQYLERRLKIGGFTINVLDNDDPALGGIKRPGTF